jgi:oligoribonuclease (3'-5' exoribonuclease)
MPIPPPLDKWKKNFHTNIMLDLECTSVNNHNPAIIEIGAVYFDIDTGAELAHLSTPVSLQSCLDLGLVTEEETLDWVEKNIPTTLSTSKNCSVTLHQALFRLSRFIRESCKQTVHALQEQGRTVHLESEPMIWGNGTMADNIWIRSAYKACSMEKPWKYWNDMCVRTMVKQCYCMTGIDYRRDAVMKGTRHKAIDDCRHQIAYLVKARNALMAPATSRKMGLMSPETSFSSRNGDVEEEASGGVKVDGSATVRPYGPGISRRRDTRMEISDHEKSIAGVPKTGGSATVYSKTPPKHFPNSNPKRAVAGIPKMLLSPETSFSSAAGDPEDEDVDTEEDVVITAPPPKRRQADREKTEYSPSSRVPKQLISPETSFSGAPEGVVVADEESASQDTTSSSPFFQTDERNIP